MEKQVIYINNGESVDSKSLENILCLHIAGYNRNAMEVVKKYHMKEVKLIRDYLLSVLNKMSVDARTLNACFHDAVRELGINLNGMTIPCVIYSESELVKSNSKF